MGRFTRGKVVQILGTEEHVYVTSISAGELQTLQEGLEDENKVTRTYQMIVDHALHVRSSMGDDGEMTHEPTDQPFFASVAEMQDPVDGLDLGQIMALQSEILDVSVSKEARQLAKSFLEMAEENGSAEPTPDGAGVRVPTVGDSQE